ncbi:MAG: hypothetical protein FWC73_07945 [Defluviitaleaceae bacterium]|nr:hypothetical protein [Defluviitaleaceae bacterium]
MRNSPDRAENRKRFYTFSATGWTDFELIRYSVTIVAYRFIHSQRAIEALYLYIDLGAAPRDYRSLRRIRLF